MVVVLPLMVLIPALYPVCEEAGQLFLLPLSMHTLTAAGNRDMQATRRTVWGPLDACSWPHTQVKCTCLPGYRHPLAPHCRQPAPISTLARPRCCSSFLHNLSSFHSPNKPTQKMACKALILLAVASLLVAASAVSQMWRA